MALVINKTFNANIYADGGSLYGMADEVNLPTIKAKTSDPHEPLGTIGAMDYPAGFEKMDGCKIKWNGFYPTAVKKFSNIFKAVKIQVRFAVEQYSGNTKIGELAAVAYLTVRPLDISTGNFKAKSPVELETNFSCSYIKLEIDGVEQYELDFEAQIYKVDGVDIYANRRAILGI